MQLFSEKEYKQTFSETNTEEIFSDTVISVFSSFFCSENISSRSKSNLKKYINKWK